MRGRPATNLGPQLPTHTVVSATLPPFSSRESTSSKRTRTTLPPPTGLVELRGAATFVHHLPGAGAIVTCGGEVRAVGTFIDAPDAVDPVEFRDLVALAMAAGCDQPLRLGLDFSSTAPIGVGLHDPRATCEQLTGGVVRVRSDDHVHVFVTTRRFLEVVACLADIGAKDDDTPPLGIAGPGIHPGRDRRPRLEFDALYDEDPDITLVTTRMRHHGGAARPGVRESIVERAARRLIDLIGDTVHLA